LHANISRHKQKSQKGIEKKGDIAEMHVQEQIINDILSMEVKMDVIAHQEGIAYPPPKEALGGLFSGTHE
jgi:hypothetical protein